MIHEVVSIVNKIIADEPIFYYVMVRIT